MIRRQMTENREQNSKLRRKGAFYIFCLLSSVSCLLLVAGCGSVSQQTAPSRVSSSDYIELGQFCQKHGFEYNFDTIDDMVIIGPYDRQIRVLLNSTVATFDSSIIYLEKPPVYFKGKILIPCQLDKVISSGEIAVFKPSFTIKTIVVDPGHGGKDPGAVSPRGLYEKDINLIVSKYLKQELEQQGFRVILTRSSDVFLTLEQRTKIAKKHNADLFISIHANANNSRAVNGVEIYYLSPSRLDSRKRALRLASSEDFNGKDFPRDVKTILWDMCISKNHSFSIETSNVVYFTFKKLGFNIKSPRQAPFYVLRHAYTPSLLFEMGYLTNSQEEKALRKKHYQKQIAQGIALAVSSLNKKYATLARKNE